LSCWASTPWASKTLHPRHARHQDNSFLVEEAYNQNFGVVQHISSFTRSFEQRLELHIHPGMAGSGNEGATSSVTRWLLCTRAPFPTPALASETFF
jgi:hypothetical protein